MIKRHAEKKTGYPKILLISAFFDEGSSVGKTKSMKTVMNIIPPLGLLYIASSLEAAGYKNQVRIVDCQLSVGYSALAGILRRERPSVVGLTCTTSSFRSALSAAKLVKKIYPSVPVMLGGAHATATPDLSLKCGFFDYLVLGEGEETSVELVDYLCGRSNKKLEEIRGIAYVGRQGKIVRNERREFIHDLDRIPFPAMHLLPPPSRYHPTPASYRKLPQTHLMTSRGCPNRCAFCDTAVFGMKYRERSVKNVMEEIDALVKKYGVKDIRFFDDTFTLNKRRALAICDEMKKRNLSWCCNTRVDRIDYDLLRKMKKSGCYQVLFGIESGDDLTLKRLRKGSTVEQNARAIKLAKKAGLNVRCDFIVGVPGDTLESMKKSVDFAIRMNPDFAHFNKFTPFPGTQLCRDLERAGYRFDFARMPVQLDHSDAVYVPQGLTRKEYKEFLDCSFKRFYLRPRYILRQILQIRSFRDIKRLRDGFFAVWGL